MKVSAHVTGAAFQRAAALANDVARRAVARLEARRAREHARREAERVAATLTQRAGTET